MLHFIVQKQKHIRNFTYLIETLSLQDKFTSYDTKPDPDYFLKKQEGVKINVDFHDGNRFGFFVIPSGMRIKKILGKRISDNLFLYEMSLFGIVSIIKTPRLTIESS